MDAEVEHRVQIKCRGRDTKADTDAQQRPKTTVEPSPFDYHARGIVLTTRIQRSIISPFRPALAPGTT